MNVVNTNHTRKHSEDVNDHSLIPPCQNACPLHMDIREYVNLVSQGRIMEALQVIRMGNPFPSICAYVCTHPCEESCRRAQVDNPIAIRSLKRFAVEFGGDRMVRTEAETKYSDKVAVVGSGPAGLACATKLIHKECPETKVLVLTQYDEEENMIIAKQSGAYGFIPKKAASSDLIRGIRYVSQGKYYPTPFAELVIQ
jgi:hypothetical protein